MIVEINGREVELPDNLSGAELEQAIDEIAIDLGADLAPSSEPSGLLGSSEDMMAIQDAVNSSNLLTEAQNTAFSRNMADAATFGFADEASAGIRSLFSDKSYDQLLAESRGYTAQATEEAPMWGAAGQVTGGLTTGAMAPSFGWQKNMGVLPNLATLASEGAAYGSLYGLGTSENSLFDNPQDVASDVWDEATLAGTLNPVVGGAMRGAGRLFNRSGDAVEQNELYGIDSNLLDAYPNLKPISDLMDRTTGGALAAEQVANKAKQEAIDSIQKLAGDAKTDTLTVGKQYTDAIESWDKNMQEAYKKKYAAFSEIVDLETMTNPNSTTSLLSELNEGDFSEIVNSPTIKRLTKEFITEDGVTARSIGDLWTLRQSIGEALKTGKLGGEDIPQAQLRALYAALTEDIATNLPPLDAYQFLKLNKEFTDYQNLAKNLERFIVRGPDGKAIPEQTVQKIKTALTKNPSVLDDLLRIFSDDILEGSPLDEAGKGVLYNTTLNNQGVVSPQTGLNNYRKMMANLSVNPQAGIPNSQLTQDYLNSPASKLVNNLGDGYNYQQAMRLAERAEEATGRGSAWNPAQVLTQTLATGGSFLAGGPVMAMTSIIGAYGLRRALTDPTWGKVIAPVIETLRKTPAGQLTPAQAHLLFTVYGSEE